MRQLQYITILLILMVAIPLLGQSIDEDAIEGNKLIASKYEMNFQDGKGWRFPDSTQFKYDDLDRLLEKRLYRLIDSSWTLIQEGIHEYQDNKITFTEETLRDGEFVPTLYYEHNYNDKGLVTNTLIQFGYNGVLQNEWQYGNLSAITPTSGYNSYEFEYNENNQLIKKTEISEGIIETPPYDVLFRQTYYYENPLTTSLAAKLEAPLFNLEVYPNPTQQEVFITSDTKEEEQLHYKIFNQQGHLVLSGLVTTRSNSIRLGRLPAGNYWILLSDAKQRKLVKKIVKG